MSGKPNTLQIVPLQAIPADNAIVSTPIVVNPTETDDADIESDHEEANDEGDAAAEAENEGKPSSKKRTRTTTTATTTTTVSPAPPQAEDPSDDEDDTEEPSPEKRCKKSAAEQAAVNRVTAEEEKEKILHRLRRRIIRGTIKREDMKILEECKDLLKFLKDVSDLGVEELLALEQLLKNRYGIEGDPVTLIQRSIGRVAGIVRKNKKIEDNVLNDKMLTDGLDELITPYVDDVPALLKVGGALVLDIGDWREPSAVPLAPVVTSSKVPEKTSTTPSTIVPTPTLIPVRNVTTAATTSNIPATSINEALNSGTQQERQNEFNH